MALLSGEEAVAEQLLEQALVEQPDFSLAALLYGETYESKNKLAEAEAHYRRAIELQPERTDARFALGSLLFRRDRRKIRSTTPGPGGVPADDGDQSLLGRRLEQHGAGPGPHGQVPGRGGNVQEGDLQEPFRAPPA